jgi:hypothetical protein
MQKSGQSVRMRTGNCVYPEASSTKPGYAIHLSEKVPFFSMLDYVPLVQRTVFDKPLAAQWCEIETAITPVDHEFRKPAPDRR